MPSKRELSKPKTRIPIWALAAESLTEAGIPAAIPAIVSGVAGWTGLGETVGLWFMLALFCEARRIVFQAAMGLHKCPEVGWQFDTLEWRLLRGCWVLRSVLLKPKFDDFPLYWNKRPRIYGDFDKSGFDAGIVDTPGNFPGP